MRQALRFKSIKTKILIGFGVGVMLVGIMGTVNYFTVKETTSNTEQIVEEQIPFLISSETLSAKMF